MRRDGFTLFELLVVLFVAAVIALICAPWIGSQVASYRFHNAVGGFKGLVSLARIRPMGQSTGSSGTIFVDRFTSSNSEVTLTVGKDPYNPEKPKEHSLEQNKPYYVTLTGLNPQNSKKEFPWTINDRMYECNCPDKNTLKCKSGELNVKPEPDPMPLSSSSVARIATAMVVKGWKTGQPMGPETDPETNEAMADGDFFRVKDKGSVIEYQYNSDNMKIVFVETDDKGKKTETDCRTGECKVIFDHSGFTKDATTYEITFKDSKSKVTLTQKILPSGAIQ